MKDIQVNIDNIFVFNGRYIIFLLLQLSLFFIDDDDEIPTVCNTKETKIDMK